MGGTVPGPEPVAAKCFHRTLSGTSAKNRQYRGIKRQPDWSQRKSPATGEKQGRQVRGRNNCRVSTWNTIRLGHFREGILTGKLDGVLIQNGPAESLAAGTKAPRRYRKREPRGPATVQNGHKSGLSKHDRFITRRASPWPKNAVANLRGHA